MPFEPLTWALGFALTNAGRRLGQLIFGKSLSSQVAKAASEWAASLPPEKGLHPEALFPKIVDDEELDQRPSLKTLRGQLRRKQVPTLTEWHLALIEQWQHVRRAVGDDAQPFFLLPETDARAALRDLAISIVSVCEQDEALFRGTVLGHLDELLALSKGNEAQTLPQPFSWSESSSLRNVALEIEQELGTRVEVLALAQRANTVHIWLPIPGSTANDIKWSLLTTACILCGIPNIHTIEIGIASNTDLAGTDARGPIGMMKICLPVAEINHIVVHKNIKLDFWEGVRCFVLANDNTPAQFWKEIPFRDIEGLR